jgi:hypothetical protein
MNFELDIGKQLSNKIIQAGYCNTCLEIQEDKYYVFCSTNCSRIWITLRERNMGQYDIDKDVYKNWLEEKSVAIEAMTTREEIEERIAAIAKIEFLAKREWAMLHQQYDKLTGRKGIAPWLKAERDALITDPDIKVNWEGEPRKKKEKRQTASDLLGFDFKEEMKKIKGEAKGNGGTPAKKLNMNTLLDSLANIKLDGGPKVEVVKPSEEEIKAKANSLRERMAAAKVKKENE